MKRRTFIKTTTLTAMSVGAFGNIQLMNNRFVGTTPTTTDILGPFYRPGAPLRTNINPPEFSGTVFHLSGTIYKEDGTTPFNNSLIEVWQCSADGIYDNVSDVFNYRGAQKTGPDGKYHFITTSPVPYPVDTAGKVYRPAHIHMRISGDGGQDLITQIYFKGDPYLETDPSSASPESLNRILPIAKNKQNEMTVAFDVVMMKEFKPDDSVFNKISGLYQMSDKSKAEFYKDGDNLFMKYNGQIMESMDYKGDNTFVGGMNGTKVTFELLAGGNVKVLFTYQNRRANDSQKVTGDKILKYKS